MRVRFCSLINLLAIFFSVLVRVENVKWKIPPHHYIITDQAFSLFSVTNKIDANRACINILLRKGTTSIQSPLEHSLKTCQKIGTVRCAERPSQSLNPPADKSLVSNKTKATGSERTV